MEVVLWGPAVALYLVVEEAVATGAVSGLAAVVAVEGRMTFADTMALVPLADGLVGNLGCSHKLQGHRELVEELVAVVGVDPLDNRYQMIFHSGVGTQYCCVHMLGQQSCSLQPEQRPLKTEFVGLKRVSTGTWVRSE